MTTGDHIRLARLEAGLTQWDLGCGCGKSGSTVGAWESGAMTPALTDLCRIAPLLHKTPFELIHGRRDVETDVLHLPSRATATVIHTPAW